MLVPRAVLEKVGTFDPELFAYSEDTDWSLRAREAGFRHYVVPASRVWHKVSAASGGESSPTAIYYDVRNALVVSERHAPLGAVGTWRRRLTIVGAHLVQAARAPRRRECLAATWQGWRDFRARRLGRREERLAPR
jgi:GT2 family glycosyltransferase